MAPAAREPGERGARPARRAQGELGGDLPRPVKVPG